MKGANALITDFLGEDFAKQAEDAAKAAGIEATKIATIYAACFNTPAGQVVLEDMYRRYVHVTRAVPGQGAEAAFYREGMAQVVFDIAACIARVQQGEQ